MNNTIMSSKNTFEGGLLMDFAPDNMSSNVMTSALNATLLTFNGNEMLLQNDMGNGRVETARLPEGYIPVGTCEFGDIIYIVSYNPILNKSLIGCFPSPERNISSEETGDTGLTLSSADFLELIDEKPTGKLKATSVKKILYSSKNMNSGDKYIIYSENLNSDNSKYLSDYGNLSHQHGTFPKLVKIHVVSIEESGKIVYLDSSTKWYDNDYYISGEGNKNAEGKLDIDSYRTLVSSAYSIFSSKVSGKLALLVELEKITGFSCSWEPYIESTVTEDTINYTNYLIHWNFNWTTNDNNINPNGALLLNSEWKGLSTKIGVWRKDNNKLIQEFKEFNDISLPPVYTEGGPSILFTRSYLPEDCLDYKSFIKNNYESEKNKQLSEFVNPYKINIDVDFETGLPNIGSYYINGVISRIEENPESKTTEINIYDGNNNKVTPYPLNDDIVNNYFNYPVLKPFTVIDSDDSDIIRKNFIFKIPISQTIDNYKLDTDIKNLVYHYKIAPTMPYGYLELYAQEGYIDFSKIGKKDISLTTWKYYNYGNTSTLTWGMDAYTEPGKGISEVVFEFYDNQGLAAAYHSKNKRSYNGVFTEHLILNDSINKYLTNIDHNGDTFQHKGRKVSSKDLMLDDRLYYGDDDNNKKNWINKGKTTDGKLYDEDDSGIIYSNCLYLVKIIVKYCNKGILGEYIESGLEYVYDYRWFWTNNMYNKYYTNTSDFKILYLDLNLNCVTDIYGTENFKLENYEYLADPKDSVSNNDLYKSLSANIQAINLNNDKTNIKLKITPGLLDDYNTFNLNNACKKYFYASIYLGDKTITNIPEQPKILFTEDPVSINDNLLLPVNVPNNYLFNSISEKLSDILGVKPQKHGTLELYDENGFSYYENLFSLSLTTTDCEGTNTEIRYLGSDGTYKTAKLGYKKSMDAVLEKGFDLKLALIHYSKYAYLTKTKQDISVLRSFVLSLDDLLKYNIKLREGNAYDLNKEYTPYFYKMLGTSFIDSSRIDSTLQLSILEFKFDKNYELDSVLTLKSKVMNTDNCDIHEALDSNFDQISKLFKFMFPLGFVVHKEGDVKPNFSDVYHVTNGNKLWPTYYLNYANNKYTLNKYGNVDNVDIHGLISGLNAEVVEPSNHFSTYSVGIHSENKGSILEAYTPEILAYLTLLFYLTDEKETSIPYPYNYVYLDKHICSYKKDIIIRIHAEGIDESSILMRKMLLGGNDEDNYINRVLINAFLKDNLSDELKQGLKQELKKHNNVTLKLHEYILTKPLEYLAEYIIPDSYYDNNAIIIKSIFESIPKTTFENFLKNEIYAWDEDKHTFNSLSLTLHLRPVLNIKKIDSSNSISAKLHYIPFDVTPLTLSKNLTIDTSNDLMLKSFPNTTSTYTLSTHHINASISDGSCSIDENRNMTNFKDFKFWN